MAIIDLEAIPEKRDPAKPARRFRYGIRILGTDRILCVSEQPFVDAARVLVAEGRDPDATLTMRHRGSDAVALKGRLGSAAELTVEESARGPVFRPFRPFSRAEVEDCSGFAEADAPLEPEPEETPVAPPVRAALVRPIHIAPPPEPPAWLLRHRAYLQQASEQAVRPETMHEPAERADWNPPKVSGWLKFRYAVGRRARWKCEACGSTADLQIDHIKPRSKYRNGDLVPENLQMLCRKCNVGKGNRDETAWRAA
jgi:hypothetical protein